MPRYTPEVPGLEWIVEREVRVQQGREVEKKTPEAYTGRDRLVAELQWFDNEVSGWTLTKRGYLLLDGEKLMAKRKETVEQFKVRVCNLVDSGVVSAEDILTLMLELRLEGTRLSRENHSLVSELPSFD